MVPPSSPCDEDRDVIVTRVAVDVDTQQVSTDHWAVWVGGERRREFHTEGSAVDFARALAIESGRPAWLNRNGVLSPLHSLGGRPPT